MNRLPHYQTLNDLFEDISNELQEAIELFELQKEKITCLKEATLHNYTKSKIELKQNCRCRNDTKGFSLLNILSDLPNCDSNVTANSSGSIEVEQNGNILKTEKSTTKMQENSKCTIESTITQSKEIEDLLKLLDLDDEIFYNRTPYRNSNNLRNFKVVYNLKPLWELEGESNTSSTESLIEKFNDNTISSSRTQIRKTIFVNDSERRSCLKVGCCNSNKKYNKKRPKLNVSIKEDSCKNTKYNRSQFDDVLEDENITSNIPRIEPVLLGKEIKGSDEISNNGIYENSEFLSYTNNSTDDQGTSNPLILPNGVFKNKEKDDNFEVSDYSSSETTEQPEQTKEQLLNETNTKEKNTSFKKFIKKCLPVCQKPATETDEPVLISNLETIPHIQDVSSNLMKNEYPVQTADTTNMNNDHKDGQLPFRIEESGDDKSTGQSLMNFPYYHKDNLVQQDEFTTKPDILVCPKCKLKYPDNKIEESINIVPGNNYCFCQSDTNKEGKDSSHKRYFISEKSMELQNSNELHSPTTKCNAMQAKENCCCCKRASNKDDSNLGHKLNNIEKNIRYAKSPNSHNPKLMMCDYCSNTEREVSYDKHKNNRCSCLTHSSDNYEQRALISTKLESKIRSMVNSIGNYFSKKNTRQEVSTLSHQKNPQNKSNSLLTNSGGESFPYPTELIRKEIPCTNMCRSARVPGLQQTTGDFKRSEVHTVTEYSSRIPTKNIKYQDDCCHDKKCIEKIIKTILQKQENDTPSPTIDRYINNLGQVVSDTLKEYKEYILKNSTYTKDSKKNSETRKEICNFSSAMHKEMMTKSIFKQSPIICAVQQNLEERNYYYDSLIPKTSMMDGSLPNELDEPNYYYGHVITKSNYTESINVDNIKNLVTTKKKSPKKKIPLKCTYCSSCDLSSSSSSSICSNPFCPKNVTLFKSHLSDSSLDNYSDECSSSSSTISLEHEYIYLNI